MKIGISACLTGMKVRYDGTSRKSEELLQILKDHELIPVCPETAAGLSIPRRPIECFNGRIIDAEGNDLTLMIERGVASCLKQVEGCAMVILKSKSPTCGIGKIYDGTFSGRLADGDGAFVQACRKKGIPVFSETMPEQIESFLKGL